MRDGLEWLHCQALMPDSVTGCSKIQENQTRLTSSLIALFNIASQFDNLLDS